MSKLRKVSSWISDTEKILKSMDKRYKTYFISGHRDITQEEFDRLYKPRIQEVINDADHDQTIVKFVVGDYYGVDFMAQKFLAEYVAYGPYTTAKDVTVYHMFDKPRNCASELFNRKGGFQSDEERDAAMTKDSDEDIAFVRKGKRNSGTAQNIIRRIEFE